ncbi:MAG TPA: cytochrome c biogenesis protein DipZ [Bryobacteraceae bacterium]|nr:cytochrome c biogenesis protein DipZ [Bryobacteraceae bacterium]
MILFALAFLGGILTIISPCILPVLPFVFAKADQPFRKSGLPLLAGMALTFAAFAAVATVGGAWVVRANQYGRWAAMVLLAIFGLTLVWTAFGDWVMRPFVKVGGELAQSGGEAQPSAGRSFLLGIATGLLWAPCAGPILGLILTGAALQGASERSALLLLAYAAGAAVSLTVAVLAGGQVFAALKRSLGAEVWIRRILGVAVLAGVAAIALGLDRGVLTQVSLASTSGLEQSLIDRFHANPQPAQNDQKAGGAMMMSKDGGDQKGGAMMMMSANGGAAGAGPQAMPELSGAVAWINSPPLTSDQLKGHVVLVDFWTYSCINCLRSIPYVRAWADKYKANGLIVIGVHTPEFAFEKDMDNVKRAVGELKITYPVAMDNDYAIWKAFHNSFWPADYLVDATGKIRNHHFGEGKYDETEQQIQELLKEGNAQLNVTGLVKVSATGTEAAPDSDVESPETYVGYDRADSFLSPGGLKQDAPHVYALPKHLELNQWGFGGNWTDHAQVAVLDSARGRIVYRFHARDVHLVLGPSVKGQPVRFRVSIDGKAPGMSHGVDTDEAGAGMITDQRLYQLIRQKDPIEDHTFEIEFLDPGAQAFSFTFG